MGLAIAEGKLQCYLLTEIGTAQFFIIFKTNKIIINFAGNMLTLYNEPYTLFKLALYFDYD